MMNRSTPSRVLLLLLSMLCLLLATGPATSAPLPVTGTPLRLEPPSGFVPAATFPGFEMRDAAATLLVAELPAPFATVQAGFTEEALLTQGMVLEERGARSFSDLPGELIRLQQNAPNGVTYTKWLALFGDDERTFLVTAGVPVAKADELGPAMVKALDSIVWQREAVVGEEGLRFRMTGPKGLDHRQRFLNNLVWSEPESSSLAPTLVAGNSFLSPAETALESFARLRLSQTREIRDLGEAEARPTRLGDLDAVELVARAKDAETGDPVTVYQVMAYDADIYFLIQGFAPKTKQQRWLKRFRAAVDTFRRVEDPKQTAGGATAVSRSAAVGKPVRNAKPERFGGYGLKVWLDGQATWRSDAEQNFHDQPWAVAGPVASNPTLRFEVTGEVGTLQGVTVWFDRVKDGKRQMEIYSVDRNLALEPGRDLPLRVTERIANASLEQIDGLAPGIYGMRLQVNGTDGWDAQHVLFEVAETGPGAETRPEAEIGPEETAPEASAAGASELDDSVQTTLTYLEACRAGDGSACYNASIRLRDGTDTEVDLETAVTLLGRGCHLQSAAACHYLAFLHHDGEDGVTRDHELAEGLYQRACDLGRARACLDLADCEMQAEAKVMRLLGLYQRACELESGTGCLELARLLEKSELGLPNERKTIERALDQACRYGEEEACP